MSTEPVVILNRDQIGLMLNMHKRTRPAPWKKPVLIEMGLREEDVDFIIMIHARFADIANTILSGITQQEMLHKKLSDIEMAQYEARNAAKWQEDSCVAPEPKAKRGRPKLSKEA